MRNAFINTIIDAAKSREDIFIVSGDAGLGVFDEFKDEFPGRFLNLGVAEQNAASFSAGLSLTGYKVYLYNIIPFVLYRCYEQVRNDICYQKLSVVLIGIGSGLTYAPQGMTHYSIEDLGLTQTLPNLKVFSPIDPIEAKSIATYSLGCDTPVYVRLPKRGEPIIHKNNNINILEPIIVEDGEGVAMVFHGSISIEVLRAREILKEENISLKLISMPLVQPIDFDLLNSFLGNVKHVISVEEHYVECGLGSMIAKEYVRKRPQWDFYSLGIPNRFVHEIKDLNGMREHFGISGEKIAKFVKDIWI